MRPRKTQKRPAVGSASLLERRGFELQVLFVVSWRLRKARSFNLVTALKPAALRSSHELLASSLAWQLQERKFGGLAVATKRKLRVLVRAHQRRKRSPHLPAASTNLRPGTVISKQWRGAQHVVMVLADGFQHQGTVYVKHHPKFPPFVSFEIPPSR